MTDFNFLSGQYGQAQPVDPLQYQVPGIGQQNYPSITPGQQGAATQGLDWSKLAQWAQNQPPQTGGYQQALQGLAGATQGPQQQQAMQSPYAHLMPGRAGGPLGQVNQQQAGYIGRGTSSGLLQPGGGMVRLR
jgi:hypothetical protein